MQSIRQELGIRLLVGACAVLLASGIVLGFVVHSRLVAEFDHALLTKARTLAVLTSMEGRALEFDFSSEHMPEFADEEDPEFFELRLRGGNLLARSDSLGAGELPRTQLTFGTSPLFRNIRLPDARRGRMVGMVIAPRVDGEADEDEPDEGLSDDITAVPGAEPVHVSIAVARSREDLDALLWSLYGTIGGIDLLAVGGIFLLARDAVSRGLRPVAAINEQVRAIGPGELDRRVHLAAPPEEVRAIVEGLNALLERLQAAFERERRFSANVAHELRTPVAELRTAAEVGAKWPEDPAATRQLFHDVREIALQMETIVTHLLLLSRCENRSEAVSRAPVSLDPVVRACWERTLANAASRGLRCESHIEVAGTVHTDAEKLGMIVQNLIDNAVSYSPPAGVVRCFTAPAAAGLELVVQNDVHDMTREDLQHVLEPFWRKDAARSAGQHAGLGLSIVKALCDLLEIELRIDLQAGRLFVVRLSFSGARTT